MSLSKNMMFKKRETAKTGLLTFMAWQPNMGGQLVLASPSGSCARMNFWVASLNLAIFRPVAWGKCAAAGGSRNSSQRIA